MGYKEMTEVRTFNGKEYKLQEMAPGLEAARELAKFYRAWGAKVHLVPTYDRKFWAVYLHYK